MDDDLFSGSSRQSARGGDSLFGWTVALLLLTGLVLVCWIGSFYVFGQPERPGSYELLRKIGKVNPPKRFEITKAPDGEFLTAKDVYERYSGLSNSELEKQNAMLLRNYIKNYAILKDKVPYVTGRFNILESYELRREKVFPTGLLALAQSTEFPALLIEQAYTCEADIVPVLQRLLLPGTEVKLERSLDLCAIVHVKKLPDGRLIVTLVPLLYGTYSLAQGSGTFSLDPPRELNLRAGFPITSEQDLSEASAKFADKPKSTGTEKNQLALRTDAAPVKSPEATISPALMKVAPAVAASTSSPTPVKATPTPAIAKASPSPTATLARSPIAAASPSATPATAVAAATATPSASPTAKPLLVSSPTPTPGETSKGSWRVYAPGQMPRGRLVDAREAHGMADRGLGGERLYLQGQFVVTASGTNRAVLRPKGSLAEKVVTLGKPNSGNTRIFVEFPPGTAPLKEGANFGRNSDRPFQITDVRRSPDGQISIYVREVTNP